MSAAPLHNHELERAVLGAVLLDPARLRDVRAWLGAQDFDLPAHALIFEAMAALDARGQPLDLVTLAEALRQRGRLEAVGGAAYLGALTDATPTTVHTPAHAQLVAALSRTRRGLAALEQAAHRLRQGAAWDGVWRDVAAHVARDRPAAPGATLAATLTALGDAWQQPSAHVPTGLWPLDALLAGGLRAGDLLALAGVAGGGKSTLAGQLALDAAAHGARVVYASVEMPPTEVVARWLALLAFRAADPEGRDWALGASDILYGRAWRGDGLAHAPLHHQVLGRLEQARAVLARLDPWLSVHQVPPGATVEDLHGLVAAARARGPRAAGPRPTVLVVDPLQRLFASARGGRTGRAVEALNASEQERVGAVAQELKYLADTEALAVVFTSDTTKGAALSAMSSAGSLRGSYQLNHLATVVLGLHTAASPQALRRRLDGDKDGAALVPAWTEARIARALPRWWEYRADARRLGARVALLECSKNRRGPPEACVLGLVPGAACGVAGEPDDAPTDPDAGPERLPGRRR
jgi:hypothetical protein